MEMSRRGGNTCIEIKVFIWRISFYSCICNRVKCKSTFWNNERVKSERKTELYPCSTFFSWFSSSSSFLVFLSLTSTLFNCLFAFAVCYSVAILTYKILPFINLCICSYSQMCLVLSRTEKQHRNQYRRSIAEVSLSSDNTSGFLSRNFPEKQTLLCSILFLTLCYIIRTIIKKPFMLHAMFWR